MRLNNPISTIKEGIHTHTFHDDNGERIAWIELDYVEEGKGSEINSEITVWFEGYDQPLYGPVKLNLMAERSIGGIVKKIEENTHDLDLSWKLAVEQAARASVRMMRDGNKEERWRDRSAPDTAPEPFLIDPFVSANGVTHLFSPPGAGKSLVALGIAYSIATGQPIFGATPNTIGPVLYLDFEDNHQTHEDRLNAICNAYGYEGTPPIMYIRLRGGLKKNLRYIRSVKRRIGAAAYILDSVGKAKGIGLGDQDAAIQLFDLADQIELPGVAVDHVTKVINEKIKQGTVHAESVMAIGSQFSTAAVRLAWFMQEIGSSTPTTKRFNLHNTKVNNVAKQEGRKLYIHIEANRRQLPVSMQFEVLHGLLETEMGSESKPMQVAQAMERAGKAVTYEEIEQLTGLGRNSVAPVVTNHRWFVKGENMGRRATYSLTREGRSVVSNTTTQQ